MLSPRTQHVHVLLLRPSEYHSTSLPHSAHITSFLPPPPLPTHTYSLLPSLPHTHTPLPPSPPLPGDLSRNRTVGLKLGRGMKLAEITDSMHGAVAEGVLTSRAAHDLAKKLGVEVPIIDGIYGIIHGETRGRGKRKEEGFAEGMGS